jgi:regulatory protein YycH of two-component signal transduction system YycFG
LIGGRIAITMLLCATVITTWVVAYSIWVGSRPYEQEREKDYGEEVDSR